MKKIVVPIIVQHHGIKAGKSKVIGVKIKNVIKALTLKFESKNTELMNSFEGPQYPQYYEFKIFKQLCEVISEGYYAFDPIDKHNKAFDDFDRKCQLTC